MVKHPINSGINVGLSDDMVAALDKASKVSMLKPGIYARQALCNRLILEGFLQPPEPLRQMLAAQAMKGQQ